MTNQQHNRSKRHLGPASDYDYDHLPHLYNQYESTEEYAYHDPGSVIAVDTDDLDTYELMFLRMKTTPYDPTRQRAFGTRNRILRNTPTTEEPLM